MPCFEFAARLRAIAFLLIAICILAPQAALAQGFQVKPMMMQFGAPAGRTAGTELDLTNTSSSPLTLSLYVVDLTQSSTGSWQMIPPDSPSATVVPTSARSWTTLSQSSVTIDAASSAAIPIRFAIPADARGTYVAGIIAEQPTPDNAKGLVVRVRFLIPVVIQILGRPVRQNVLLSNLAMERVDVTESATATTRLEMSILNDGRTYSRVRGQLTLRARQGDQWRMVTRSDIPERGIIPGVTLTLPADIGRRLPSGDYRLSAELYVDGRRVPPMEKDLTFNGDPDVNQLAFDTALLLEPPVVTMKVVPGATRTSTLAIENPGNEPIHVSMASGTPRALQGVVMGALLGSDLSAEPWTQIQPNNFILKPGRTQNVRVIGRIPKDGAQYPNYYADLIVEGTYESGQSAGETRSTVHLVNSAQLSAPKAIVEQFALSETDAPGKFTAQVRLVNTGNVDIEPAAILDLLTTRGDLISSTPLSGEPGILLPLGNRTYGAEIDLSGVDPGTYVLRVRFPITDKDILTDQHVAVISRGKGTEADGDVTDVPIVALDPENIDIAAEPPPDVEAGPPASSSAPGG